MIKVRFAANPTDHLNVAGARVALASFLFARRFGGQFVLRFADLDRGHDKPSCAEAIARDLQWLGIEWDAAIHQSDRLASYQVAAERLKHAGRLYPCFESDDELRAKRDHRLKRGQSPVYDRAMLRLTPAQRQAAEAGGKRPYWRFRLSDHVIGWHDMVLGHREVTLPSLSDPVLIRADGTPMNAFTALVDDVEGGITHLILAEDHVARTAVQFDIAAALGADARQLGVAHLPMLIDAADSGPSKRLDRLTLRTLRNDGIEAAAIAAYLAWPGIEGDRRPPSISELAAGFDLEHGSRPGTRFDATRLLALNRRQLRNLPLAAVADRLPDGATQAFWRAVRGNLDRLTEARGWWDVVAGTIVPPVIEGERDFLLTALDMLPQEPWSSGVCMRWIEAVKQETGREGDALLVPLRLALTGEAEGPALHDLLPLMGRARVANRLQIATG
jgi:glutamyl-tRNA synthetase